MAIVVDHMSERYLKYTAHLRLRLSQCHVPAHLHDGLVEYVAARRPTGGFLQAVLENDLRMAVRRADVVSAHAISSIVLFLLTYVEEDAWGSPEEVQAWLENPNPPLELFE